MQSWGVSSTGKYAGRVDIFNGSIWDETLTNLVLMALAISLWLLLSIPGMVAMVAIPVFMMLRIAIKALGKLRFIIPPAIITSELPMQ